MPTAAILAPFSESVSRLFWEDPSDTLTAKARNRSLTE
jgi:hypothetical protein